MSRGRPLEGGADVPMVDTIQPTRELSPEEAVIWNRWVEVASATRPLMATDAPLLTVIVELEDRKAKCRAVIAAEGAYVDGKRHPAQIDMDSAHRDFMALVRELGLTPASFKNVRSSNRPAGPADRLKEFLGK